jgi:hypothetical protein
MKASVQYNDIVGTAAADVSDFFNNNLQSYLKSMFKDFDGDRYRCDGCRLYMSDHGNHAYVKFVCYDTVENKYVYLVPVKNYTLEDMTKMFKRFDVVMGRGIDGIEVSDDDWIDLE